MKQLRTLLAFALVTLIFGSCASNQVNNGGFIQKRKYTKGFHHGHFRFNRSSDTDQAIENKIEDEKTAKPILAIRKEIIAETIQTPVETAAVPRHEVNTSSSETTTEAPSAAEKAVSQKGHHTASAQKTVEERPVSVSKSVKKDLRQTLRSKKESSEGGDSDLIFVLCIILAIILPPVAVLVWTNIDWIKVLIALLLTLLFFLPGVIYALLVVLDKV